MLACYRSGEKITRASIKGKTHRVLVDCVVSKPLLSFSDSVIYFDKCHESQTFKIKNQGNNDANIMINTEDLQSNFSIDFSNSEGKFYTGMITSHLCSNDRFFNFRVKNYNKHLCTVTPNLTIVE